VGSRIEAAPDVAVRRRLVIVFCAPRPGAARTFEAFRWRVLGLKPCPPADDPNREEILAMALRRSSPSIMSLAVLAVALGCAHRDWRRALDEDSAGAYHRFLREHPDSGYAEEARARLAFVQIRNHPTRDGYRDFVEKFRGSPFVVELRPIVEASFFEQARASGTAGAYEEFLQDFGDGTFADRARGNAEYLRNHGFENDPSALAAFASRYPASDFAPEAERSVASLRLREQSAFHRVGLIVDVDTATPGAERLRRTLAERAVSAYRSAGLDLVPAAGTS
jgi:hypothetical protein